MMNKELMETVAKIQNVHGESQFLFVGDPYQLNPIGEDGSMAFDCPGIELTTVMRQAAGSLWPEGEAGRASQA